MPKDGKLDWPSDVAMWHKLSGAPDGVTDEGLIVQPDAARRYQAEKEILRARAHRLAHGGTTAQVRALGRLAASYLLAGDVETARRYLDQAERKMSAEAGE